MYTITEWKALYINTRHHMTSQFACIQFVYITTNITQFFPNNSNCPTEATTWKYVINKRSDHELYAYESRKRAFLIRKIISNEIMINLIMALGCLLGQLFQLIA